MKTAISKNGNVIRLTNERWQHISTGHPEMAGFYFVREKGDDNMETVTVNDLKNILPWFMKQKTVWANYDEEADVLYMHFKKPNRANHSEMTEDDIIIRYENDEVIGVTVLNASKK